MESLKPKLFEVLHNYSKEQLIKDIISGIIVAIIALPLSIALAIASGVTPECGLYTAVSYTHLLSVAALLKLKSANNSAVVSAALTLFTGIPVNATAPANIPANHLLIPFFFIPFLLF